MPWPHGGASSDLWGGRASATTWRHSTGGGGEKELPTRITTPMTGLTARLRSSTRLIEHGEN
ncbi:hypothetical protein C9J85_12020 [Haloferax sp. wsp5]|nr:hypothetical protein C9J85_12020 [Haloferax sp. wsp5]